MDSALSPRRRWNTPGVPHTGWHLRRVEDLSDTTGTCAMCGQQHLRYLHHLHHAATDQTITAGVDCAALMVADADVPKNAEKRLKSITHRRSTWLSQWRAICVGEAVIQRRLKKEGMDLRIMDARLRTPAYPATDILITPEQIARPFYLLAYACPVAFPSGEGFATWEECAMWAFERIYAEPARIPPPPPAYAPYIRAAGA